MVAEEVAGVDPVRKIEEEIALLVAAVAAVALEIMKVLVVVSKAAVVVLGMVKEVQLAMRRHLEEVVMVEIMKTKQSVDVVEEVAITVNLERRVKMVD